MVRLSIFRRVYNMLPAPPAPFTRRSFFATVLGLEVAAFYLFHHWSQRKIDKGEGLFPRRDDGH